jgi:dihydrofolate reductase
MKAIAAMGRNRVIGEQGTIPWHLPEDFRWFKRMTLGGVIVMGRRTFESLGKPLPGRRNVVVSSAANIEGVECLRTLSDFKEASYAPTPVWIIGGANVYAQLLPRCSDLYLSLVDAEPDGDAFFPEFEAEFQLKEVVAKHDGFEIHHYQNRFLHKSQL